MSDSPNEISSIMADNIELKSSTQAVSKINDSFESSILNRNGSDSSFISQTSNESSYVKNHKMLTLQLPKPSKIAKHLHVENNQSRPASILKTTFLSEDTMINIAQHRPEIRVTENQLSEFSNIRMSRLNDFGYSNTPIDTSNYNFPKKPPHSKDSKRALDSNVHKPNERPIKTEVKFLDENNKPQLNKENSEKICELENQILKKDALIETLRMRVTKMVQELEETHRKISLAKNSLNEDNFEKINVLNAKCEEYEKKISEYEAQAQEMNALAMKKEKEASLKDEKAKGKRIKFRKQMEYIYKIENELKRYEEWKIYFEQLSENLQIKLENANKALDISNSHKNHLEQEIVRLEIIKRRQENEMKVIIDENSKSLSALTKKLEDSQEESSRHQCLLKEAQSANERLLKDQKSLTSKLSALEDQLSKIDLSKYVLKDRHLRSNSSNPTSDPSKIAHEPDHHISSQKHCSNCCSKSRRHSRGHANPR